jgi:mRNA interferase RelE/StbE
MRKVLISEKSAKQINKFPDKDQDFVLNTLALLEKGERNLDIKKIQGENNLFRIRKGNYRILFEINKINDTFEILEVATREKSYRKL